MSDTSRRHRPATLADELWRILSTLACSCPCIPDVHAPALRGAAVRHVAPGVVVVGLSDGTWYTLTIERREPPC